MSTQRRSRTQRRAPRNPPSTRTHNTHLLLSFNSTYSLSVCFVFTDSVHSILTTICVFTDFGPADSVLTDCVRSMRHGAYGIGVRDTAHTTLAYGHAIQPWWKSDSDTRGLGVRLGGARFVRLGCHSMRLG